MNLWMRRPPETTVMVRKPLFASPQERAAAMAVPEWQKRQAAPGTGLAEIEHAWAGKTEQNAKALAGYLDSLPPEKRAALESGPDADSPATVQHMLAQARLPRPADMSRSGIEQWMRSNRADYFRNQEVQQAYSAHIAADLQKE